MTSPLNTDDLDKILKRHAENHGGPVGYGRWSKEAKAEILEWHKQKVLEHLEQLDKEFQETIDAPFMLNEKFEGNWKSVLLGWKQAQRRLAELRSKLNGGGE